MERTFCASPHRMILYEPQTYYILAFRNPLSFQFHFQRTQNREHLAKRKTNDETEKRRIEEHVAADFLPFVEFIVFCLCTMHIHIRPSDHTLLTR